MYECVRIRTDRITHLIRHTSTPVGGTVCGWGVSARQIFFLFRALTIFLGGGTVGVEVRKMADGKVLKFLESQLTSGRSDRITHAFTALFRGIPRSERGGHEPRALAKALMAELAEISKKPKNAERQRDIQATITEVKKVYGSTETNTEVKKVHGNSEQATSTPPAPLAPPLTPSPPTPSRGPGRPRK